MARQLVLLTDAAEHRNWATERYLRRLVASRLIPFHRIGRRIYFDLADLDRFCEDHRVEPPGTRLRRVVS